MGNFLTHNEIQLHTFEKKIFLGTMTITLKVEIDQDGVFSIKSAEGDVGAVEAVKAAFRIPPMPQTLVEQMVFEKFLAKYQNNLTRIDNFLDTL